MPLLLGPVLDLILIAMLSRHRWFWLGVAAAVACGFSLFGDMAGHGAGGSMELLGGSR